MNPMLSIHSSFERRTPSFIGVAMVLFCSVGGCGSSDAAGGPSLPASCNDASQAYAIERIALAGNITASASSNSHAFLPVAVSADGHVFVGMNDTDGGALVADLDGPVLGVSGARIGGVATTQNGLAALLFDSVDERWAAVHRFSDTGEELFSTDLFRSANLVDEGTKGEAGSSRFGYLSGTDSLVAYFGHTQRYGDDVRHQGGYLATVDSDGEETRLSGWFGSHNLDQRLWADDSAAAVLGLGDAYPIGIFFSHLDGDPSPRVVYRLAAAGNGTANGQLGGLIDAGEELIAPFLTNLSVSPDLDAGEWPDIDPSVSDQIREGANNPTDMGLLRLPKSGDIPDADDVPTIWLEPELSDGARLDRLKSARYGDGNLLLLLWAEVSGSNNSATRNYFTMVVDPTGAVCQPKTPLEGDYSIARGDDLVRAPDGTILWANDAVGSVSLVRLTPAAE